MMRCPFKRIGMCDSDCALWIPMDGGGGMCSVKAIFLNLFSIAETLHQFEMVDENEDKETQ